MSVGENILLFLVKLNKIADEISSYNKFPPIRFQIPNKGRFSNTRSNSANLSPEMSFSLNIINSTTKDKIFDKEKLLQRMAIAIA